MRIYDTFGRMVYEIAEVEGVHTIPILNWKSGMYVIEVLPADGLRAMHKVLMVQGL